MNETRSPFFNAPEKKLEIALIRPAQSFRQLGAAFWRGVVEAASAHVLSRISNAFCDAYLLSESSLFVYDDRVIMITCGGTSLVPAAFAILRGAHAKDVGLVIYERKGAREGDGDRRAFDADVDSISGWREGTTFEFCGDTEHPIRFFVASGAAVPSPTDTTLEVLMHRLDSSVCNDIVGGRSIRLGELVAGFDLDEHVFAPPGYSLNGIRDREYCTVHVTPNGDESYASFETNRRLRNPPVAVESILRLFSPECADVVYFRPAGEPATSLSGAAAATRSALVRIPCGYDVELRRYERSSALAKRGSTKLASWTSEP